MSASIAYGMSKSPSAGHDQAMTENFNPPSLMKPVGFSHATGSGATVHFGGQVGSDATGRILAPGDMASQFAQAIRNLGVAIEGAGCVPQDVVKITYLVTDVAAYRAVLKEAGAAYREVFGKHFPASTLIEVKGLFDPDALVEIECVAVRGGIS